MNKSHEIPNMKNKTIFQLSVLALIAFVVIPACAVVRPGEVGVKQRLGKLDNKIQQPGLVTLNPLFTKVIIIPTRTVNLEVKLNLPSKEGLNVSSEISILYNIQEDAARSIIQEVGSEYEDVLILSVFRSAASDVCAQFFAKDMHSGNRGVIEQQIKDRMESILSQRGFNIEAVLMKSINLPPGLYMAIEEKLRAEQDALRMEFILQTESQEAERKKIEAIGTRDAQRIISEGLNPFIIQWRSLEVFSKLSSSPNAKIIITDGNAPILLNADPQK
jgi:regulator of protease activity HflC (stomatin/prohibitin superfamily)